MKVQIFDILMRCLHSYVGNLNQIRIGLLFALMEKMDDSPRSTGRNRQNSTAFEPPIHVTNEEDVGQSSGSSSAGVNESGSFDCNICLELAQHPVVSLCGHLFCWPCLYRWLQSRSLSKHCPVCKATVQEEKLIPLNGRDSVGCVDPRTKAVPGVDVPHRPAGQRPETANRASEQYYHSFGHVPPSSTARFAKVALSAGLGLHPSPLGIYVHEYTAAAGLGFPLPMPTTNLQGNQHQRATHSLVHDYQQQEATLSKLLFFLGCFAVFCLIFF